MPTVPHEQLRDLTTALFARAGAPPDEARVVADHLVDANLCGHDSHGLVRVPAYVKSMQRGVTPSSQYEIVKETPATTVIDAKGGLGAVAATRAMTTAVEKARARTFGAVGVHQCGHTGRLGDYPPRAASAGMIGICLLNGGTMFTAPFGGVAGRLPPNPISVAVPRRDAEPIVLDMTTSVVAGGKIDVARIRGSEIPDGWLIDGNGHPVRHADKDWSKKSAVLPLGGFQFGHKGFGLGFIIDCLAGGLTWAGCSCATPTRGACGFLAMAINIADFIALDDFYNEVERLVAWCKECPRLPGVDEIFIPGEVELRQRARKLRDGIPLDDAIWEEMASIAHELGVTA